MTAPQAAQGGPARAEYRVFGHGLIEALQPLLFNGRTVLQQARRMPAEVYLVPVRNDAANVKVRGGLLDLKVRTAQTPQGYEVFEPRGKWPLPVTAAQLGPVWAALEIPLEAKTGAEAYGLPELIALARSSPDLRVLTVEKHRYGFMLDGVVGEYARVWMNGAVLETVCLESADLPALTQAATELQLLEHPNTSYVRAAQRLLGLI